ncbi:hypothetical protein [Paraburkholderia lacunae]|uniref:Uncharacterized protein n=1 Tax=Paraburkholderia lacunae TaxID=2211104 RepID=A0A370N4Q8_9BURK|nr:hypothetical protein [Paraburkholderia lacunae]RDK00515.1 hypothetical protein DLM46_23055 [Paraburkholderia lacunae]
MARPKIAIFGALMGVGGWLALRYVKKNRASQVSAARELSRWEDEGGTVATPPTPAGSVETEGVNPATHGANGSEHPNGNGGAWPFPRS